GIGRRLARGRRRNTPGRRRGPAWPGRSSGARARDQRRRGQYHEHRHTAVLTHGPCPLWLPVSETAVKGDRSPLLAGPAGAQRLEAPRAKRAPRAIVEVLEPGGL